MRSAVLAVAAACAGAHGDGYEYDDEGLYDNGKLGGQPNWPTLIVDNVGQVNFNITDATMPRLKNGTINHNLQPITAEGGYGQLTIKYAHANLQHHKENAAYFMDGLDPGSFMPLIQPHGFENDTAPRPKAMNWVATGNLSAEIHYANVSCGSLRIGIAKNGGWWFGGKQCTVIKQEPTVNKKGAEIQVYALVCTCDKERQLQITQEPTAKKHHGKRFLAKIFGCSAVGPASGKWAHVASSPGGQNIDLTYGVNHAYQTTVSKQWSRSTEVSVSTGFSFAGFSVSTTVSHTTSYDFSVSHSTTFAMQETNTYSTTLPAGTVWQFQMAVTDDCGDSTVLMRDFQITDSAVSPPCCLPGFFKDAHKPYCGCVAAKGDVVYDLCNGTDHPDCKDTPHPAPGPGPAPPPSCHAVYEVCSVDTDCCSQHCVQGACSSGGNLATNSSFLAGTRTLPALPGNMPALPYDDSHRCGIESPDSKGVRAGMVGKINGACANWGCSQSENAVVLAMAMQESDKMDHSDTSKGTTKGSSNFSPFNLNMDELQYMGCPKGCAQGLGQGNFNDQQVQDAVGLVLKGLRGQTQIGNACDFMDFHRGGTGGWKGGGGWQGCAGQGADCECYKNGVAKGCQAYKRATADAANQLLANPSMMTDGTRVCEKVPWI